MQIRGEVRIVQIKIEEKRREGGEDFFEGEREVETFGERA